MASTAQADRHDQGFAAYLRGTGALEAAALDRAMAAAETSGQALPEVIVHLGLMTDLRCRHALANFTGAPEIELADLPADPVPCPALPLRFQRLHHLLVLQDGEDAAVLVAADPTDLFALRAARLALGKPVSLKVATQAHIDQRLEAFARAEAQEEDEPAEAAASDADIGRLRDLASEAPVIRQVNRLIARAVERGASDIHLEPREDGLSVRFRIDGTLIAEPAIAAAEAPAVISRIKLLSQLNIAEQRLPQDGRLRRTVQGRPVDFRVATLPSIRGETVVLRILDRSTVSLDFADLGFDGEALHALREQIGRPNGIVLVTGPTGSGKTTTLYAALKDLNRPGVKIITVEDPVEYELEEVVQVQVNPAIGLDFAAVLRSTLRHNPNILLIGEIRDVETARIAVEAALTGHLVLATLHTNSAAASVSRLLDMGVEDFLLATTLSAAVGQRLVRRLCDQCKQAETVPRAVLERLAPRAMAERTGASFEIFRPNGCAACNGTGYRGRTVIYEVLPVDAEIRPHIYARRDAQVLQAAAQDKGFLSMRERGVARVLDGIVALEDVVQATRDD
ncbi:MAG: GspE/PulE family protein [Rhodothalassiaceae bacterium]